MEYTLYGYYYAESREVEVYSIWAHDIELDAEWHYHVEDMFDVMEAINRQLEK